MRRLALLLAGAMAVLLRFHAVLGQENPNAAPRETVLDRKEHLEEGGIQDVPNLPRLCDGMDLRKQHLSVGDCKLYCEQEGQGTPLVLIHGGPGATHHCFHPHFSRAKEHFRVIYYDQRGCGLSEYQKGAGYSVDQAVEDLEHLRQALEVGKWLVLGHSYGGNVAQCYAVKYPERVAGFVLVGSALDGLPVKSQGTRQYDFLTAAEAERIRQIHRDEHLPLAQQVFNAHLNGDWKRQSFYKPSREELARMARYEWNHDETFRAAIGRSQAALDLEGVFERCPLPVLILEGKWDLTWTADKPKRFAACFPGAKLVVFERSGHAPFADEPEEFFRVLTQFAGSLPGDVSAEISRWKTQLAALAGQKEASPQHLLKRSGWGLESSKGIAEKYSKQWIGQLGDPALLLRAGFALYDVQRYEDALAVFQRMSEAAKDDPFWLAVGRIWQGHMLDLLDRRAQALAVYRQVVGMDFSGSIEHSQYGLTYSPSTYAAERLNKPFARLENRAR